MKGFVIHFLNYQINQCFDSAFSVWHRAMCHWSQNYEAIFKFTFQLVRKEQIYTICISVSIFIYVYLYCHIHCIVTNVTYITNILKCYNYHFGFR